jgi:hypothetical protein
LIEILDEVLARVVGGMGFAGEDELDGPVRVADHAPQPLDVAQQERRPLVGREAPRKPDRQRIRVEQHARRHDLDRVGVALHPLLARPVADERLQLAFQVLAHRP